MTASKLEGYLSGYTNVKINDFSCNVDGINSGIIFLYCEWSPTFVQLQALLNSLSDCPAIALFILDIDEKEAQPFIKKHELESNGWGETYWVKKGKIISFLRKYNAQNIEQLVTNNKML
jgi:hypothetical protein